MSKKEQTNDQNKQKKPEYVIEERQERVKPWPEPKPEKEKK